MRVCSSGVVGQRSNEGVTCCLCTLSTVSHQVPGIGKVTERMLNALEVTTCGDLYKKRALLLLLFSTVSFQHFLRVCLGIGSTDVDRWVPPCLVCCMVYSGTSL